VNLADLLVDHPFAEDDGLLFDADRQLTAGEARREAREWAERLAGEGLRPGQAVAVRVERGIDTAVTMAGVWLAGGVHVPLNGRAPQTEVERIVNALAPALYVAGPEVHPAAQRPHRYESDVAFVTWTSGTTSAPKPILHTHAGYLEILDRVLGPLRAAATTSSTTRSPNLVPVSLALNAGLYNLLFGLRAGAPVVLMDRFDTATFASLVRRFQIRSTVLPPGAIAALNADDAITDLAPLRYVRSITAPLSPTQARRFRERFGAFVLNGYGQAEIGEVVGWTAADAKAHPDKLGAVGRPHPGVAIRVAGPAGEDVEPGTVGRLLVRPPGMARAREGADDLESRTDRGGYVDTGDLARVDTDGFVWIEGRASDLINRGGNKVFPDEVEAVLRAVPGVSDAAVVAGPDDRLGEVPTAFVVCPTDVDDAELEAACRRALVPYKVPVAFHRIDRLPRNEIGKLVRRELTEQLPT
jgi:long-chain acyl-CoA synthetase